MGKRKKTDHGFDVIVQEKNLPPLVLDQKWHQLFSEDGKPAKIARLEQKVSGHLSRQGHLNQEKKDLKALKNKLMKNIVANMDEIGEEGQETPRLQENRRLITEINQRMEACRQELEDLQDLMQTDNEQLMIETMEYCYGIMSSNEAEREELADWIVRTRVELKKKIIRKDIIEDKNREIYTYLHDVFGGQVIGAFDLKYGDEYKKAKK
ncbi:hypothetical protein C805_01482 [Eubacterium sp. 14-2]|uniref:hypothetical protein n=1 Tax=Eubacterium sp. 14-2 TaxID=1235790 RepID=UPI000337EF9B|nr:hypothetical protein [Eubacterium sp. 14-2]EOT27374.1 hypothetical protein C805_01482 [Eubacterium sp. 14-2]